MSSWLPVLFRLFQDGVTLDHVVLELSLELLQGNATRRVHPSTVVTSHLEKGQKIREKSCLI